jgi:predicted transposase YbfD/YdcC
MSGVGIPRFCADTSLVFIDWTWTIVSIDALCCKVSFESHSLTKLAATAPTQCSDTF